MTSSTCTPMGWASRSPTAIAVTFASVGPAGGSTIAACRSNASSQEYQGMPRDAAMMPATVLFPEHGEPPIHNASSST